MNTIQQKIMIALVKAQESVIAWGEEPFDPTHQESPALDELDSQLKAATKLAKQLRKE